MSDHRGSTVLVLGGIRSGKSVFAESLVADAPSVRYVATAVGGEDDPEWRARIETHQRRRPQSWSTEETGADPTRLTDLLREAKPDDTLVVDDLGGWVAALLEPARQPNDDEADVAALAAAVRGCAGRVVLVSPEVGLSLVPATPLGRAFADALGSTNQALADACDRVALVVAGRAVWLKSGPGANGSAADAEPAHPAPAPAELATSAAAEPATPAPAEPATPAPAAAATPAAAEPQLIVPQPEPVPVPAPVPAGALDEPTMTLPQLPSGIEPGIDLPLPDADAGPDARDRLETVDLPGVGMGALVQAVEFAAATQATVTPRPWSAVRVLLIAGNHAGGASAGDDPADVERRVAEVENGGGVVGRLAGETGADVAVLRTAAAAPIEEGPATGTASIEAALGQGWQLANAAADEGKDLLVLASIGAGTDAAATAILAAQTGAEPVAVLPRVLRPGGRIDDEAWMVRCAAVRDALHRTRQGAHGAKDLLRELGGADLAVATGAVIGAAARRLPVLLDGPVGIAAGLIARDVGSQTRHWCLLAEGGGSELVRQGADVLGVDTVLNLGLGLGEGANALAVLPLLRAAIGLAGAVPVHPSLAGGPADDAAFAEPQPHGPGPATTDPVPADAPE